MHPHFGAVTSSSSGGATPSREIPDAHPDRAGQAAAAAAALAVAAAAAVAVAGPFAHDLAGRLWPQALAFAGASFGRAGRLGASLTAATGLAATALSGITGAAHGRAARTAEDGHGCGSGVRRILAAANAAAGRQCGRHGCPALLGSEATAVGDADWPRSCWTP